MINMAKVEPKAVYPGGHDFDVIYLRPSQVRFAAYQRRPNERRIERIDKEFNADIMNEPKVSFRDGCYWCYDGQHTIAAWQRKFGDKPIKCKVYRGLTYAEEAKLFAAQTGIARMPLPLERFRALAESGDTHVRNIINGAEEAGYFISYTSAKSPTGIVAIEALTNAYDMLGMKGYCEMLLTLRNAWPNDQTAINGNIITGMAMFFRTYYGEFKIGDLIKSLKRPGATPVDIMQYAKTIGTGKRRYIAKAILNKYNKGRTANRLDDRL